MTDEIFSNNNNNIYGGAEVSIGGKLSCFQINHTIIDTAREDNIDCHGFEIDRHEKEQTENKLRKLSVIIDPIYVTCKDDNFIHVLNEMSLKVIKMENSTIFVNFPNSKQEVLNEHELYENHSLTKTSVKKNINITRKQNKNLIKDEKEIKRTISRNVSSQNNNDNKRKRLSESCSVNPYQNINNEHLLHNNNKNIINNYYYKNLEHSNKKLKSVNNSHDSIILNSDINESLKELKENDTNAGNF